MHYALNDLVLSAVDERGVDTSDRTSKGRFKQSPNIGGARQVKTANPLDDWKLNFRSFQENGMQAADILRAMQKADEPITVSNFEGDDLGQWVIMSVNEKGSELDDVGTSQVVDISVTLSEYDQDESDSIAW